NFRRDLGVNGRCSARGHRRGRGGGRCRAPGLLATSTAGREGDDEGQNHKAYGGKALLTSCVGSFLQEIGTAGLSLPARGQDFLSQAGSPHPPIKVKSRQAERASLDNPKRPRLARARI